MTYRFKEKEMKEQAAKYKQGDSLLIDNTLDCEFIRYLARGLCEVSIGELRAVVGVGRLSKKNIKPQE